MAGHLVRHQEHGGAFKRAVAQFRQRDLPFSPGRCHIYVSLACPWASRTIIFHKLKGLTDAISMSVVEAHMGKEGWTFATPEPLFGKTKLHELYTQADPTYSGRVTVPILWDKQLGTIVNNESSEIIRLFNGWTETGRDLYPETLRDEIDAINAVVYDNVNNGVYKAGFATVQEKYEEAFESLFTALEELEKRLTGQPFLVGQTITEAD